MKGLSLAAVAAAAVLSR
jgi:hypothetical protein